MNKRYWVNAPSINDKINDELFMLGFYEQEFDGFVFKTFDKSEAKRVALEAGRLIKEATNINIDDSITISVQPYCEKCETLARFSAKYCDQCGEKVMHEENVDFLHEAQEVK